MASMWNKPISECTEEEKAKRRKYARELKRKQRQDPAIRERDNAWIREYYRRLLADPAKREARREYYRLRRARIAKERGEDK